jgi:D-tyrosyl-tRNA(Tyr) deacylase
MRAVIQRVNWAKVEVEAEITGQIDAGLCVLVGVGRDDDESDAKWLAQKTVAARIFKDDAGKMNRSVLDIGGRILAVSQFTLLGDLRRGTRPSFTAAMTPAGAAELFETFCGACRELGVEVQTGVFGAHMEVTLDNTGPVTLLLDSHRLF